MPGMFASVMTDDEIVVLRIHRDQIKAYAHALRTSNDGRIEFEGREYKDFPAHHIDQTQTVRPEELLGHTKRK